MSVALVPYASSVHTSKLQAAHPLRLVSAGRWANPNIRLVTAVRLEVR
jgi:hypothetical protein